MMITANPTRSQLWIEPTGKVHEFDDVTHGKWAMDKLGMAYHPELEEDADGFTKEIPEGWMDTFEVEQEAQSQLLKAGWIRMGFFRRGHAAVVYVQKDSPLTPAELGRAQTWIMQHPEWQGPAIDVQDPKLWTVPMADFLAAKKTTEFRGLKTAAGPIPLDTKLIDRVFRAIVSNIKGYWGNYDAPIGERELSIAFSLSATPTNVSGEERQGLNVKLVFEDAYLSKAVRGAEVYPGKWPTLVVYLSGKLTGQDITKRLEGLEGFYLRGILVHELAHVFDHIPDEALGVSPKDNAEAYYNLDTEVSAYATQLWHYIVTNADYYREGGADWLRKTGEKGLWSLVDSALTLRIGNGIRRYCNEANRRYILQVAYRAMQEVLESPESKAASLKIAEDAGITKADLQRIRPILREWVGGGWTDGPQLMRLLEKHKDILAKFRMSKPVRLWRNERAQLLTRGGQDVTGPSNAGWEDQYTRPSAWSATRMHAESYASGNGRRLVTAIVPPEDTYCYIPLVEQAARALGMKTFDPHQQDEVIVRPNPSFLDQIRPKVTGGEEAQLRRDYELAMVEYHLPQLHELRKTNPKAISDEELKRRIADIAKHKEIHDVRDELAKLQRGKAARKNASIIEPHFNEKLALSRTFYRVATVSRVRYETALETLYPALNLWVFYGKRGDKEQLLSAYAGLPPQLRAAWDAEVHRTFLNTFGPSVKVYRRLKDTGPAEPGSSYTTDPQDTPGGVDSKVVGPDEVLAHWGQQGTPLASKAFGHEHEIILKPHAVVTASQVRHYQPKRLSPSDVLVTLDVAKVDASWRRDKTFYIEPGGGNQLRGRYDRFAQWLQDNQGTPIDPLDIGLTPSGEIIFGNGRHRFAVLRDQGAKRIAATVPKQDFKTMAERFGAQPVQGTSVTASGSVQTLVGRAKQLTKQDPLYEALGPYECGAFDGGCLICAEALISAAGRGDLVRLVDVKGRTHHYGARIDGLYCDFSGAYPSGDMWAKTFARLEHVREALHAEEGLDPNYQEEETPRDPQCSREIAQLLLGSKTAKTFDQLYPATPEWVGAAKAFFLKKWQERAQERGMSLPVDVSNACKFGSRFAQKLFGGTLRGNWHHQFVQLPDGQRVDLGEDAMDRQTHGDDASWYAHDKTFWGNREHRESMASVEPRVTAWVTEFQKEHPVSRIAKTLYHGTSTERAQRIQREGLEPQVGDLTATAYEDDAESVGEELEPLTFAGDKDALQRGVYSAMLHAIQAEGHDITDAEQAIRNWGALVILRDGDEVMDYRHPDDGVTNPTEHPMQVEPEDYYSRDNVAIDYILTGPTLVRYLKRHGVNMERWTRPFSEQQRNALVGMVRRAHPDVPVEKILEKVDALTFEQFHKSWDYYTRALKRTASNNEDATGQCHCTVCGTEIAEGMVCTECAKTCQKCGGPTRNCKCASFVHAKDALCHDCWGKHKTAALTKGDIQGRRRALEAFFPAELVQAAIDEAPVKTAAVASHFWLSPTFEVIKCLPGPMPHDDMAQKICQERYPEYPGYSHQEFLLFKGWARCGVYFGPFAAAMGFSRELLYKLQELFRDEPGSIKLDEWIKSPNGLKHRRAREIEMSEFLTLNNPDKLWRAGVRLGSTRTIGNKTTRYFTEAAKVAGLDFSGWYDPWNAKLHALGDNVEHAMWAKRYMKKQDPGFVGTGNEALRSLFKVGWIRVRHAKDTTYFEMHNVTPRALGAMQTLVMVQPSLHCQSVGLSTSNTGDAIIPLQDFLQSDMTSIKAVSHPGPGPKVASADAVSFQEHPISAGESSFEGTKHPGVRVEMTLDYDTVGALEYYLDGDKAYVRGITVAPHYRGLGLGQQIYDEGIASARRHGATAFYSDQVNAMSPDAHKAWARIRQRHPVTFEPGEGGYESTGRHRIELKTAATQNRVWVLPTGEIVEVGEDQRFHHNMVALEHFPGGQEDAIAAGWFRAGTFAGNGYANGVRLTRQQLNALQAHFDHTGVREVVLDLYGGTRARGAVGIQDFMTATSEMDLRRELVNPATRIAALTKGDIQGRRRALEAFFPEELVQDAIDEAPDTYTMPKDEAVEEHERLIKVLRSPDHADDLREADEQAGELKKIKAAGAPTIGFNVNDSEMPWTEMILAGKKTIETRDSDSLRPHVGERVGIVRTGGRGPAALVGYCTLGEPKVYRTNEEFRADNAAHQIPAGPQWDLQPGAVKFGYPLADVEACEPKRVEGQGRVFRRIAAPLGDAAWQHILSRFPKEFQAEVLAERSGKSLEDIQELQNWRLTSRAPVVIPLNAAFIQQQCEAMHLPAEVVQRINEMWGLGLRPSGQVYDPNPERYFRYAQMPAATANPSIMLGPDIVWGVGRFVAACLRGDRSLRVWKLRQGKSASFLTKDDIKARAREIEQRTGKSSRQLLEEMYARQDEHFPGFVKEASVFYHGGGTEKLPPSAAGILWLTDDVHAAASHAMKYLHHGTPSLWKVTLKDDAKLVALWDLSDPIVRKVKEEVSEERRMTHGRGVSDEEWVRHAADFGALEAFPWMLKQLRAAGVDGVWVHEQHAGRKRLSLGLINGDAQTSQEPQALHPDVEHAHA